MTRPGSTQSKGQKTGKVRCASCRSPRIRGIVSGYCEGRITLGDDGRAVVEDGAWVAHDEGAIESGSVLCENCGDTRYVVAPR